MAPRTHPLRGVPQAPAARPFHLTPVMQRILGRNRGNPGVQGSGTVGPRGLKSAPIPQLRLGRNVKTSVGTENINVRGLQHFLRNKGYDVSVDGNLGPQTKAALRDAVLSGRLHDPTLAESTVIHGMHGRVLGPKGFDTMIHASENGGPGFRHPIDSHGNTAGNAMGGLNMRAADGPQPGNFVNDKGTQKALKAATGKVIPAADASFGQMFDVNKMADALAKEQFQPQINDAQLQVNRDPTQAAQNEADVANWYKQVTDAQQAAAGKDTAATNAGVSSINDAAKALIQSMGGGANQGSGDVAAAGQNGANTLQAIGNSQSGLDAELAPILAAQAAQQKTDQANIDQTKQANDQQVLSDLQGQRGNAETSAQMQLLAANNSLDQARNSALMNILQYNNSLGQQKFQNQLGLTDAQIAAAMNGVTMGEKQAQAAYYANRARAAAGGGGSGRSASQLNDIGTTILHALASKGMIQATPSGGWQMAKGFTPAQVLQAARGIGAGYGNLPGGFIPGTVLGGVNGY